MRSKSDSFGGNWKPQLHTALILLAIALAGAGFAAKVRAQSRARHVQPKWKLVWSDEFDAADGSAPDATWWTYDTGVGGAGWGNKELEYYTKRPDNISIQGGNLVITARRETFSGPADPDSTRQDASGSARVLTREYTSARIKTQGLFSQAYGRFEARIRIPSGQGMWPAFWMLGADVDKVHWPACGEIDVMENIGKEPSTVHGSLHGPGPNGAGTDDMTGGFELPGGQRFSDGFHVYGVEWQPGEINFYVDKTTYFTATPRGMPHGTGWVFDHPFFLLLNLAVGGNWPGSPDSNTQFPQQMLVDYVRVYAPAHPLAAAPRPYGDRWLDAPSQLNPLLMPAAPISLLRELP